MLKSGLNFSDINLARKLIKAGYNAVEIARECHCQVDIIEKRFFTDAPKTFVTEAVDEYVEPESTITPVKKKSSKK